jgi:fructoselysine-6-P-deglycase FrlB-like protein
VGRPFKLELSQLAETYSRATETDLGALLDVLGSISTWPLLAVGSGGSLSLALAVAELHSTWTGQPASAVTPLELVHQIAPRQASAVVLLTASGNNRDILTAFEVASRAEMAHVIGIVGQESSRVHRLAKAYSHVRVLSLPTTTRDGFLATNSLISLCVPLVNAFRSSFGGSSLSLLPPTLDALVPGGLDRFRQSIIDSFSARFRDCQTLVVLYSPGLKAIATDIESKFTEAALGETLLADFRNFGHGRHHWLDKNASRTGVITLAAEDDVLLARSTLHPIPDDIPRLAIQVPGQWDEALLTGILTSLFLTEAAGELRGIDPGRPGVPTFGSRLYSLPGLKRKASRITWVQDTRDMAIRRKIAASSPMRPSPEKTERVGQQVDKWVRRLTDESYGGIVFDYDDTLCGPSNRFTCLDPDVSQDLAELLEKGITIGVATGRGKSARLALCESIPKRYWKSVVIGYYNGSVVSNLADESAPDLTALCDPRLVEAKALLLGRLGDLIEGGATLRADQLTIEFASSLDLGRLAAAVREILMESAKCRMLRLVHSTRSIDILTERATKIAVLARVQGSLPTGLQTLAIGDSGRCPGNDYELLSHPFSLSCDTVSPALDSCWNLLSPGCRGRDGLVQYLSHVTVCAPGLFGLEGFWNEG